MRVVQFAAALAAAVVVLCPESAGAAVGRTPGAFAVSPTGAATYTVPLWTPPGIGQLAPSLSLGYSSEREQGVAARGWSIGGQSAITRCARTVAQDGSAAPVELTAADRFCLDGQRLRLTGGQYGADGSTYATEVESYSRITARGKAGTGPEYFTVERPDGLVYEYGTTADARVEAAPAVATARHWALARVRDRAGNSIRYFYSEDTATGEHRLASIEYPYTATGAGPYYRVEFVTEPRPATDVQSGYLAGYPWRDSQRLTQVRVAALQPAVQPLRRYELQYQPGPSGRGRVVTLTECASGADCLAPTRFTYEAAQAGWMPGRSSALSPQPVSAAHVLWLRTNPGSGDTLVYQAIERDQFWLMPNGAGPAVSFGPGTSTVARGDVLPADLDGDTREDLAYRRVINGTTCVYVMTSLGTSLAPARQVACLAGIRQVLFADLDADGRDELLHAAVYGSTVAVRANQGGTLAATDTTVLQLPAGHVISLQPFAAHGSPARFRSAMRRFDLGGDAREDVLLNTCATGASGCPAIATNYRVLTAGGTGAALALTERAVLTTSVVPLVLDANGDGLSDLAYAGAGGTVQLRFGTGTGLSAEVSTTAPAAGFALAVAADSTGDGMMDLLLPATSRWNQFAATGSGLAAAEEMYALDYAAGQARRVYQVGDDSYATLVTGYAAAGQLRRADRWPGPEADALNSVLDGFAVGASDLAYRATTYGLLPVPFVRGLRLPQRVLLANARTDGTGTEQRIGMKYAYANPRIDRRGRGFLGYGTVTGSGVDSLDEGVVNGVVEYQQDFPLTGRVARTRRLAADGATLSELEIGWATLALGSGPEARVHPYAASTTQREWEVSPARGILYSGEPFSVQQTVVTAIDPASGLVTDSTTTTTATPKAMEPGASVSRRVTHAAVLNDTTHWCLGRPLQATVTQGHSLAGGEPLARRAALAWDASRCRLTEFRVAPGDPDWQVTTGLGYDEFGNATQRTVTGARMTPRTTSSSYGTRGQFIERTTDALGQVTRYAWRSELGEPASLTDPNGLTTNWSYDAFGRPTEELRPDGTRTRFELGDCAGAACGTGPYRFRMQLREVDDAGRVYRSDERVFDRHERPVSTRLQSAGGWLSSSELRYDSQGHLAQAGLPTVAGQPSPGRREFHYDERDRLTANVLLDATGQEDSRVDYDYRGLDVASTDPRGQRTAHVRSPGGYVLASIDAAGGTTRYEYDGFGQLRRVIDAADRVVATLGYNARGMKLTQADPDTGEWAWQFNALGEVTAMRSPATAPGNWTRYFAYDPLGRLVSRTEAEGTTYWTWGTTAAARDVGQLVAITAPGYAETRSYDALGRPRQLSITTDATYSYDYAYNGLGQLDTLTYPETLPGRRLSLRYEYAFGHLSAVRDAANAATVPWQLQAVDAAGNVIDEKLGERVQALSSYELPRGHLVDRTVTLSGSGGAGPALLANQQYEWDDNGNLAGRRDAIRGVTETFAYDALDRLVAGYRNGVQNLGLGYDASGNITWKSDVGGYTYDATRPHVATGAGDIRYGYDAAGQVIARNGATVAWTSYGLPKQIRLGTFASSQFAYGPSRERYRHIRSTKYTSEQVTYAGGLFEKVTQGLQSSWRQYVVAPTGVAAVHVTRSDGTGETYYVTHDQQGGTHLVIDAAGGVVKVEENFEPFGRRRNASWDGPPSPSDWNAIAATTPDGYGGHEHLDNLDLVHMNGRVYDPAAGRFLSADPLVQAPFDGQSLNRYSYVFNNPLTYTDPTGFDADGRPYVDPDNGIVIWFGLDAYSYGRFLSFIRGTYCVVRCIPGNATLEHELLPVVRSGLAARNVVADRSERFTRAGEFALGLTQGVMLDPLRSVGADDAADILETYVLTEPDSPEGRLGKDLAPALAMVVGPGGREKAAQELLGNAATAAKGLLPSSRGVIRTFVQPADQIYYRVYSGQSNIGKWLTATRPRSSSWAREALALPPGNEASFVQEVLVPAGTRMQRSRAATMPDWGRQHGGAEQFHLLDDLPPSHYRPAEPLP